MNYQYTVKTIIAVPPESFAPPPKVDSAVVTVVKHDSERACTLEEILIVLDLMSQYSRKTLNKISKLLAKRDIQLLIPEELKPKRVEELGWSEMEMIVKVNA
jgi:16S rRNA A1518/A1519 N6-dimethyltransferase RsmA/KsgA/DIM1 with predicted DNA glycosylase/AP lyase activity